jgi:hypothetical protein
MRRGLIAIRGWSRDEATIHRSHRFFTIYQSVGKYYGKPIFSNRYGILWDFFSFPVELLSVFPIEWSMGKTYGTDELWPDKPCDVDNTITPHHVIQELKKRITS